MALRVPGGTARGASGAGHCSCEPRDQATSVPAWHLTHAHHPPQMAPPPVAGLGCLLSAESNRALLTLLEPEEAFKGSVRHPAPIT